MAALYSAKYFDWQRDGAKSSAEAVAPRIRDLFHPNSVLDFGCGTGVWLYELSRIGVSEILGIDGEYVPREKLLIDPSAFMVADLSKRIDLGKKFDLVISLEVAEHIPLEQAQVFIDSITNHADVVVFSAAIPFQGGPSHCNEQWPVYWANLFKQRGFVAIDVFRKDFWNDERVEWWYRQNMLLYMKQELLERYPDLKPFVCEIPLSLVHPRCFEDTVSVCKEEILRKRYSDGASF